MVLATKSRRPTTSIKHKKRYGQHHRQTKHYLQPYWPYIPIIFIVGLGVYVNGLLPSSSTQISLNQASPAAMLKTTYYGVWLIAGISVLMIGSLLIFIIRHTAAWKKVFVYGEKFSVEHPWVDIMIVTIVTAGVVINHAIAMRI
jgi:hypothetical protein